MATIRTQLVGSERRIITKVVNGQRRVSCSCCEEAECCMYPADQLGIGYTEEDLPDQIEVFDGTDTFIYNKNGSIYEFQNQSLRVEAGIGWVPFLDEDEIGDRDQPCLIAPNDTLRVTDLFADTYYFSDSPTNANNIALNRISLCVWESEEWISYANFGPSQTDYYGQAFLKYVENIRAYFSSLTWDSLNAPEKSGFVLEIVEYVSGGLIGYKQDPQNKPDGTYIGAVTPTLGRNVVITE